MHFSNTIFLQAALLVIPSAREDQQLGTSSTVPKIKITDISEQSRSGDSNSDRLKMQRSFSSGSSPDRIRTLTRGDTTDSKSSNSSSVTADFLSEEQREMVRKWLGPGQLLLLSYSQRAEKIGNLPDDNLVVAELFLILKKIRDEDTLIVTARNCRNLRLKNISEIYIKFYLMFGEQELSKVMKRKTKRQMFSDNMSFGETFIFNTNLDSMLLQVSLWSGGKGLSTHRMLGEAVIHLDDIESVEKTSKKAVNAWYKLLKPDI